MATINQGANGPFRGKAGSIIGSGWKKIAYIKGRPRRYKNKGKPSDAQHLQHKKFVLLNQFLSMFPELLAIGFQNFMNRSTARNAAFQYNYEHAFLLDEKGEPVLNYAAIQLSRGSLFPAGAEKAEWTEGQLKISWNPKTYGLNGSLDDEVHILIYLTRRDFFFSPKRTPLRYEGEIMAFNQIEEEEPLYIWLFLSDSQRKRVSPTVYFSLEQPPQS